ncbi:hypothetical protein ACTXGL_01325 [Psychrobacter sp. T6-6]|uniref:hypothetical protein n=1 Tax=Psychrobacter sp. T6-6 TaxID=3457452 RepID=UPI003FD3DD81
MAAVSKAAVQKIVDKYRKAGLGDQQIAIKLLKRKDNVGKNLQTAVERYQEAGSQTPLEDVMGMFSLNPSRAKGSRVAGQSSSNTSIGDKLSSYATSAAMGLADAYSGIWQMNKQFGDKANTVANSVLGTNLDTTAAERYNKEYEQANLATDGARSVAGRDGGDWVRGGAEIAATLPIYAAGRGTTLGARMADQGVRGAAVGAAQYADDTDDRLLNMGVGAAGGAIGQGVGEKVGSAIGKGVTKAVNARRGNLAPAYKEIDDLGKQFDVRTSVGDIKGGGVIKNTESHLERLPVVGIGKFRSGQNEEATSAAGKITGKLKRVMSETDYKALPTIRQAAAAGDRNAARVLNIVETAGDDTGRVLQASAEVRAFREGKIASRLYDKVDEAVAASGNDIITPTKSTAALNDALQKQSASLAPDDVLQKELTDISSRINDPDISKSFSNMRLLRSQLGDLADKYGSPVNGNKAASKVFADIRQAVDDDIADFALNSGNAAIKKAYKRADKFYKQAMKRSDKAIARAMDSNKPDEIYKAFVKTGRGDRANNFYQALDQKGQAALRYQMADEAIGKATNESTGFSPAKFAGEFERMSEPYGNIFKGDDKKQMDGLVKLMRHVERAGQYKENPPTGVRLTDFAIIGGAATSLPLTLKVGGAAAIAKTLLTTRAGKNLLLAANKLPESQQAALDNILKAAAKITAAAGAKTADAVASTKVSDENSASLTSF